MSSAKKQSPVGAVPSELRPEFERIRVRPDGLDAAIEAELRENARTSARLFGGTARQRYRKWRRLFATDPLARHHVIMGAELRMIEATTTRPVGVTQQ